MTQFTYRSELTWIQLHIFTDMMLLCVFTYMAMPRHTSYIDATILHIKFYTSKYLAMCNFMQTIDSSVDKIKVQADVKVD